MSKIDRARFSKTCFPAENAVNMPEKPFCWHFLEISSLVIADFLHKDAYQEWSKIPEIAVFADFYRTFSLYFVVFFHTKTLFVRSFVRSFSRSFARSFVRSYFHYQVGPMSMWLVITKNTKFG